METKLQAADGTFEDRFGWSVGLADDTVLVGAKWDDDNGSFAGSAYVFVRMGGAWIPQTKLLAPDGAAFDQFGSFVSLAGDTALIGAYQDTDNGPDSGSAWVFERSNEVWSPQAKLLAPDGSTADLFGFSVSVAGNTALVGAPAAGTSRPGSAYVFVRVGGAWTWQGKLQPSDGADGDEFGFPVSVSSDTALVGAHRDDDSGLDSGSAYVFVRNDGRWTEQAKLLPSDGAAHQQFGVWVSVSGDTAAVGAKGDADSGAVYIFVRKGDTWTQQAKLRASDGASGDSFGTGVSLLGDTVLVGASDDEIDGTRSGSAYVFTRHGEIWTERVKLLPGDGIEGAFGFSVSLSSGGALVGAPAQPLQGAAYVNDLALELTVSGECPGGLTLDLQNATPNGKVAIAASHRPGSSTISGGVCAGHAVDLLEPKLLAIVTTDSTGGFSVSPALPPQACGAYLQAVDLQRCMPSNVAQVPE